MFNFSTKQSKEKFLSLESFCCYYLCPSSSLSRMFLPTSFLRPFRADRELNLLYYFTDRIQVALCFQMFNNKTIKKIDKQYTAVKGCNTTFWGITFFFLTFFLADPHSNSVAPHWHKLCLMDVGVGVPSRSLKYQELSEIKSYKT